MNLLGRLKYLIPSRRRSAERDMQEELASLQAMADAGELGNTTIAAENARAELSWAWLEQFGQDLRYAARSMMQHKSFTALAVISLALGIGANTAIYSFMDAILFRSLPVPNPDTLVVLKWRAAKGFSSASSKGMSWSTDGSYTDSKGYLGTQFPYPAMPLFEENKQIFSGVFCYFKTRLSATIRDETELLRGEYVSGNFFAGMSVAPAAGRLVISEDDRAGTAPVAVLSYRLSERRFGGAANAVGQTIRINNVPFSVIGVAPAEFFGAEPGEVPDIYVPMHANLLLQRPVVSASVDQQFLDPNFYWIEVMARLQSGITIGQAQAVLAPQFQQFTWNTTSTERQRSNLPSLEVHPGGAGLDSLRRRYAQPVYLLTAMVGLILLIACANIANLLLARAVARRREIAVRLSIGAGRARIVRQLMTESVVLGLLGGALGVAFTGYAVRVLTLVLANGRENFTLHATINWHVLAVTVALSLGTGILFGLAPALQATRVDVMPALKETRLHGWSAKRSRFRQRLGLSRSLIVVQIALSLILLVAAGLFSRTLARLHSIQLGFARENVLLFNVHPRSASYEDSAYNRIYEELRSRFAGLPGVRQVSFSTSPFPSGGGTMTQVEIAGIETPRSVNGDPPNLAAVFSVGPSFFDTMQMARLAGRDFTERDGDGAPRVVVINETLAKVFGLANPVGRTLTAAKNDYEIIAVVRDAVGFRLKDDYRPTIYFSYLQGRPSGALTFEIRSSDRPLQYASSVREIVRQLDSRIPVSDIKTQAAHIDQSISSEVALARLCTAFAVLALTIACVGLYGTVAFNVARRTSEIGIRMALGAQATRILWLILREVLLLTFCGLAIGFPVVLAATRYVRSFLYGIEPNDPLAIAGAIIMLVVSGLAAGYIPARRAAHIDPMVAVRHD
jgi:macrolide transport system ATP-binding/permease protein